MPAIETLTNAQRGVVLTGLGLLRNPNQIAIGPGDSRHENFAASTAAANRLRQKSMQHPLAVAAALMGQCFRVVYNGGMSGAPSGVYLNTNSRHTDTFPNTNNLEAMFKTNALYAYFGGAFIANDFDPSKGNTDADGAWFGYTPGGIGIKEALVRTIQAGMRPIICTDPGAAGFSAKFVGETLKFNRYLREFARRNPQCILIDYAAISWKKSNADSTKIVMNDGFYGDGTHLIAAGSFAHAFEFKRVMASRIPTIDRLPITVADTPAQNAQQLVNLPLMSPLSATPNAVSGFTYTGQFPAGLAFAHQLNGTNAGFTGTATAEMVDDPNGYGKAVRLSAQAAAVGEQFGLIPAVTLTNLTPGETVEALVRVNIAAGAFSGMNLRWLRAAANPDGTGQITAYDMFADAGGGAAYGALPNANALDLTLSTELTLPSSFTSSGLSLVLGMASTAANGVGTMLASQFGFYRVAN